jgi:hypothetical protein
MHESDLRSQIHCYLRYSKEISYKPRISDVQQLISQYIYQGRTGAMGMAGTTGKQVWQWAEKTFAINALNT